MRLAREKVDPTGQLPVTYFGDAAWDVAACEALGINLVIVGNKVPYHQQIKDFNPLEKALRFLP